MSCLIMTRYKFKLLAIRIYAEQNESFFAAPSKLQHVIH